MRVHHLPEVDSTSDHARRLLSRGERTPFWVVADSQTGGRGRLGRDWVSRPGNLYCTGALPTSTPVAQRPRLSFAAALAVHDVLSGHGVRGARLKWPNDVLVADRKVAGILLESDGTHMIVGIGLNLAHHPSETRWPATHTAEHGWSPRPTDALQALAPLVAARFAEPWDRIRTDWLANAYGLGDTFTVERDSDTISGTLAGLGPEGELRLRTASGVESIVSGDVRKEG